MGRTKKAGTKQGKTKKNKLKEEDLEDLYSDSETDSDSDEDSETDEDEFSLSNELDKAFISSYDDIKDGDMTMPVFGIGISLIAILGYAIYQGSKI
jgi:hypothetical protein